MSMFHRQGVTYATVPAPQPPPGWVPPTQEQRLERSLTDVTEIVYGVVTRTSQPEKPALFKVHHVYRGTSMEGKTVEAPLGWGHPEPFCLGMMSAAPGHPIGAYGVIAFRHTSPVINLIKPDDVQIMIREGWIRSAQAR